MTTILIILSLTYLGLWNFCCHKFASAKAFTKKGGAKDGGVCSNAPDIKRIEVKIQKPSPAKQNLREILDYNLKRKYAQLKLATTKKKELEDQGMILADCEELQDVQQEIIQIRTKMRSYNDQLDELADEQLSGAGAV